MINNAKFLSIDSSDDIKEKVDDIWKALDIYKGEKANLRKLNQITMNLNKKEKY